MSTLSGITPYNGSAYDYTGSTPSGSTSATNTQLTNALQTQDSVNLQTDASLINSDLSAVKPVGPQFCKLSHKYISNRPYRTRRF